MRVIVAGSRSITDYKPVHAAIVDSPFWPDIDEIVHGGAQGVDASASKFVELNAQQALGGPDERVFPAEWDEQGKVAGPIRNAGMADYADALIAVWDGESRGTKDMIDKALHRGLDVYIKSVRVEQPAQEAPA